MHYFINSERISRGSTFSTRAKSMNSTTSMRRSPLSIRAIAVCEVFNRDASSACESFAAFRADNKVAQSAR